MFVSDVVDATVAALEKNLKNRAFNIASGKEITILKLAKMMQEIIQAGSELKFSPSRAGDIARSIADVTRARSELGFIAGTSMKDGLSTTVQWLAQGVRTKRADQG